MSRIRSQLDSLLQEPRPRRSERPTAPETADHREGNRPSGLGIYTGEEGDPAGEGSADRKPAFNELDRIRTIIDDLAGKIGSSSSEQQPQHPVEAAVAQSPAPKPEDASVSPRAPVRTKERAPASSRETVEPLFEPEPVQRREARQLETGRDARQRDTGRDTGSDFGSALSGEIRHRVNEELEGLREQLGEVVAVLGQNRPGEELRQDIYQLAEAVARLEGRIAQAPDGLEEIVGELRHLRTAVDDFAARPAPQIDMAEVTRSIEDRHADLLERLQENVGAWLDQAGRNDSQINSQIGALSDHVGSIRDAIEKLPLKFPVTAIEARLEELAHQIDGLLGNGDGSLNHDFTVVNERLDEISRAIVAMSVSPAEDAIDRVEARLASLSKTVEAMAEDARTAGSNDASEKFAREILTTLEAIDGRISDMTRETPASAENLDAITARIGFLSEKIDNLPALGSAAAELIGESGILNRLDEISARLDALAEHNGELGARGSDDIIAALQMLAERIDELSDRQAAPLPDAGQLAGLEKQLAAVVSRIGEISTSGFEFGPINDRLDSIEQQVAHSRDIAIEVASEAAERAVNLARSAPGLDADLIEKLRLELRTIDTSSRDIGVRNADALHSVHEALIAIAERLGDIESRVARSSPMPARAAEAAQTPGYTAFGTADRSEPGDEDMAAAPREAAAPAEGESRKASLPPVADAPSLDAGDLPADEDVPLEPGSGAPDFVELVRRASAKRKSGDKATQEHGTSDLIAAARRAAHAAARETARTETVHPERDAESPAEKAGPLSGLMALLGKHRKTALMSATAIVIALAAVPLATRFLAQPQQVGAIPADPSTAIAAAPSAEANAATQDRKADAAPSSETRTAVADDREVADVSGSTAPASDDVAVVSRGLPQADADQTIAPVRTPEPGDTITAVPMPPAEIGNVALRQAAANGDGEALFEVARRYTDGDGIDRDLATATQWYEYSARTGLPLAQYRLANFFEKGHGVGVDLKKAVLWYQRAAEQGNALAMHNLAVLHTSGVVGDSPDMKAAVEWFSRAAQLGVKDSQVNLGILYARGMGVAENLVEAYKWFAVAARAGDQDAAGKRDTLANAMRPDQLSKARGLAELWKPDPVDPAANGVEVKPEWTTAGSHTANAAPQDVQASASQLVERAQRLLARRGFDPGPADGLMGRKTRDAVMGFQKDMGMPVDGEVTTDLVRALENGSA